MKCRDIENMKMERIFYYTELSKIINETINLMRFCNRTILELVEKLEEAELLALKEYIEKRL